MVRYFFNVSDAGAMVEDDEGTEFSNLEDVRVAAMRLISDVARDAIYKGDDNRLIVVVVTDEAAASIYTATLNYTGS